MSFSKIQRWVTIFSLLALLVSCQEEVLTPGEVTGKKIASLKKQKEIQLCNVTVNNSLAESDQTFNVEGQFLVIGSVGARYYDLNNLISFSIVENGSEEYFIFVFN